MPQSGLSVSGVVLNTTYNDATAVAGGTDSVSDVMGILWGPLFVGGWMELDVDVAVVFTGGTTPAVTINVDRYTGFEPGGMPTTIASNVATGSQSGNGTTSFHIGAGLTTIKGFGRFVRVTWTGITGAPTAISFQVSVIGKGG